MTEFFNYTLVYGLWLWELNRQIQSRAGSLGSEIMENSITESRCCKQEQGRPASSVGSDRGENVRGTENSDVSHWKRGGEWSAPITAVTLTMQRFREDLETGQEVSSKPRGGHSHACDQGPTHGKVTTNGRRRSRSGLIAATSHQWKISSVLVALGHNEWKHPRSVFKIDSENYI